MSKYLNGLFVTEKEGQYGKYLLVSLSEDGLKSLNELSKSDKGYRSFIMSPQKNDPTKYSCKPFADRSAGSSIDDLPF